MSSEKGEGAAKGSRSESTSASCRARRCESLSAGASRCTRSQGDPAGGGWAVSGWGGRVGGRGDAGPGFVLTALQPLAHADQQLGAHPEPDRLPSAAAPGPQLVQDARQRQRPDQFHSACGEGVLSGWARGAGQG